ncbi:GSU2403 family nucleotidyltransferase fold protein [Adlercreutzia mucosicola]|nr:GSU2403 family nucleotidyltransferase fold protein [Adlercreutzia mucosicola]MCR2035442.1 nucleotidyltransferase domain-containing protein [Adlercreutzia mucosicola]
MRHEEVFWDLIGGLEKANLLPCVMVVGSWAEYLYTFYFGEDYLPNLKSHDIDVFYGNPYLEVDGSEQLATEMAKAGFLSPTEGGCLRAFYKEGLEVEFLASQMGTGPGLVKIPNTEVVAEKLANTDMFKPLFVTARGYKIKVPSPASYLCHKLYINRERRPASKRPKDIEAVRLLLAYLQEQPEELMALGAYIDSLSQERRQRIRETAAAHGLLLP